MRVVIAAPAVTVIYEYAFGILLKEASDLLFVQSMTRPIATIGAGYVLLQGD